MTTSPPTVHEQWPSLPFDTWHETQGTLHRWMQIVGKVKLALTPFLNQWWNVAFTVTTRGLTTGPMPAGAKAISIDFDFCDHLLLINDHDGRSVVIPLYAHSVASFYAELMGALQAVGVDVAINPVPVEIPDRVPFDIDVVHASYDPDPAQHWWRILLQMTLVLQQFCSHFAGKSSPVHFFWGSFDLNTTRFSGRAARPPEGAPKFLQLAEDQENYSCGFWPGNTAISGVTLGEPAIYAYVYPEPSGYRHGVVHPLGARYDAELGEFILPYDLARRSIDPAQTILEFLQTTYEAATRGRWDRLELDRQVQRVTLSHASWPKSASIAK